jgi:organic radical activating enzyme
MDMETMCINQKIDKLGINNLVIETTRRCNIQCAHCLRGKAQNKNMSKEIVDALLNNVDYIGSITFSGGEPSLNVPIMEYFLTQCKNLGIGINDFYIATNGVNVSLDFVVFCLKMYTYCEEKEACSVQISNDYYHQIENEYDDEILQGLKFFGKRYKDDYYNYPHDNLIDEGYAKESGAGKRKINPPEIRSKEDFDEQLIYLNCNGDIIAECDLSYENQNKHKLCKVENIIEYYNNLKN